jgi:hypothetical protein
VKRLKMIVCAWLRAGVMVTKGRGAVKQLGLRVEWAAEMMNDECGMMN